jgi:hypothetical protein
MAAFNHLGLFPRSTPCPRQEDPISDVLFTDIWISSSPAFLYACAHYWRVKTWRVSVDATFKERNEDTVFSTSSSDLISQGIERLYYTYPSPPEEDDSFGTTPSSEAELICGADVDHSLFRYQEVGSGATETFISYAYDYNAGGVPAIFRLDGSGNVSEVKTPFSFYGNTTRWNFRAYPFAGNTGTYGTFTYTLLGQSFTTPIYGRNFDGSGLILGGTLSITASIVPEEYWPYDPGDGKGPIYNTAFGNQLRPFPQ